MTCILCDSSEAIRGPVVDDFEYGSWHPVNFATCQSCGLIYQDPIPSEKDISTFYPANYRNHEIVRRLSLSSFLKQIQMRFLARRIALCSGMSKRGDAKILDIGCGSGGLLLALRRLGWDRLFGSDLSESALAPLREQNILTARGDIDTAFPFLSESFDLIIMNNVIEHLRDPVQGLKLCRARLAPKGTLVIITPNSRCLGRPIFGKFWAGFHAPRHLFIFDPTTLTLLGEKIGFTKNRIVDLPDPGQWAMSTQNLLQGTLIKKLPAGGLAWYTSFLAVLFMPLSVAQTFTNRSSSIMAVFTV